MCADNRIFVQNTFKDRKSGLCCKTFNGFIKWIFYISTNSKYLFHWGFALHVNTVQRQNREKNDVVTSGKTASD